jgi:hypothetical protein
LNEIGRIFRSGGGLLAGKIRGDGEVLAIATLLFRVFMGIAR